MRAMKRTVRAARKELAVRIAGRDPRTAQRIEEELARLNALGLTEDEQVQVIDSGARLYAAGVTLDMVTVFAKIAATGVFHGDHVAQLSRHGITPRISPQTAISCWSEVERDQARRILGGA